MTITVTDEVRVAASETLTFTNEDAFLIQKPWGAPNQPRLTIEGTVLVNCTGGFTVNGIYVSYGGLFDDVVIAATGVLKVTSTATESYAAAYGYDGFLDQPNLINRGLIEVTAVNYAVGAITDRTGYGWLLENSGTIRAISPAGDATGVIVRTMRSVVHNGADITANGHRSAVGVDVANDYADFVNNGRIVARTDDPTVASIAVNWTSLFQAGQGSFVNNGVLDGTYALKADAWAVNGGTEVYVNNGTMIGKVQLGSYGPTLVNNGAIQGDVILGIGADTYDGRLGTVTGSVSGGAGGDMLRGGPGGDKLFGEAGDDTLFGSGGTDTLDGGAGLDSLSFAGAQTRVTVDLGNGLVSATVASSVFNFENVVGSAAGDLITGASGANRLAGEAGDDQVFGAAGADTIDGGDGMDYLRGDDGDDQITGGADFDDINGNMGNDTARGGVGDDWVVGGKDNDVLYGDDGGDIVYGNLGDDTCDGGVGNDLIRGGQANDSLSGGAGNDWLSGDRGNDTLAGGAGADIFHGFSEAGIDRVTDFSVADGDRVQLDLGTGYTVAQVGADVVISAGDAQMILVGVQLSSLPTGWIFVA